jgi:hypothetical protein
MTKKTNIKTLLLVAVAAFGLTVSANAQSAGTGLLGQSYVGLDYSYSHLHSTPVSNVQGFSFEYNQPLNTGFDLNLGMDDDWSSRFAGTRARQQDIGAQAIAFIPDLTWGRPFIGVGAGWVWTKAHNVRDNSFVYTGDAGVEFQVTKELSLTPLVSFTDTASFHTDNKWAYGVKANYWITSQWAVTAAVMRDNMVNTTYSAGLNFRF